MNNEEKFYAAKVLKESSKLFEKEINILNTLKSANNQNIVNIISSGEGISKNQYLVYEYTSKDEVFNYIYWVKCGLSERNSKVIFIKIFKGFQACHNSGICNILVDENFNPKIYNFGFPTENNEHFLNLFF